jgi:hypothetical protein
MNSLVLAAVVVTFTWDGVQGVAAYRVDCGLQPDRLNLRRFWTQDYGPPLATTLQVEVPSFNRPYYCAVRGYNAVSGRFSNYSNRIQLAPLRR